MDEGRMKKEGDVTTPSESASETQENEMTSVNETEVTDLNTAVNREKQNGAQDATSDVDVAALIAERDRYLDQFQRARADYANFKRRVEQEQASARQQAARDILLQLLPIVDDFERALANAPEDSDQASWVAGTRMILRKLQGLLERYGVRRLDSLGQPFDPKHHEAVTSEPGSSSSHVVEVYQEGYYLGDSVLRPAMVKIGDLPADQRSAEENVDQTFQA
jgi:molecular chaperone GrpE